MWSDHCDDEYHCRQEYRQHGTSFNSFFSTIIIQNKRKCLFQSLWHIERASIVRSRFHNLIGFFPKMNIPDWLLQYYCMTQATLSRQQQISQSDCEVTSTLTGPTVVLVVLNIVQTMCLFGLDSSVGKWKNADANSRAFVKGERSSFGRNSCKATEWASARTDNENWWNEFT